MWLLASGYAFSSPRSRPIQPERDASKSGWARRRRRAANSCLWAAGKAWAARFFDSSAQVRSETRGSKGGLCGVIETFGGFGPSCEIDKEPDTTGGEGGRAAGVR